MDRQDSVELPVTEYQELLPSFGNNLTVDLCTLEALVVRWKRFDRCRTMINTLFDVSVNLKHLGVSRPEHDNYCLMVGQLMTAFHNELWSARGQLYGFKDRLFESIAIFRDKIGLADPE